MDYQKKAGNLFFFRFFNMAPRIVNNLFKKFVSFNVRIANFFNRHFPYFAATQSYHSEVLSRVDNFLGQQNNCDVLEVGGIDRPLLKRSSGFRYDGMDIEHRELCDNIYDNYYVQSIEEPIGNEYDLIISMTLLEHVKNNNASVAQMYKSLRTGGCLVHYLPSKNHPYSIILRLIGPKLQKKLVKILRPWAADVTGYPAFFDCCSPSEMKGLCKCSGFTHIEIIPFYRANDYFSFFIPCYIAVTLWENICKKFNWVQLCSGFVIIAKK